MTDQPPKHPIQPLVTDERRVVRFKANAIVKHLLEYAKAQGCGLNELACLPFTDEDREQLAQLIGYSHSGAGDLSYVKDETLAAAARMHHGGESEAEARANYLREELDALREGLIEPIARLFGKHPDDLKGES